MVTLEEVVNIGPVRHKHTVPAKLLFHPSAEEDGVGVGGDAVDGGTVHHCGEGAGAEALQERSKEFLPEVILRDDGGSAVLTAHGNAVTHEVLDGHGNVLKVYVVGVFALKGQGFLAGKFGLQVRVFAEAFPQTGPAGITAEVHDRGEHPGNLRCAGFISHCMAHLAGEFTVESGAQVNLLRVQGAFAEV